MSAGPADGGSLPFIAADASGGASASKPKSGVALGSSGARGAGRAELSGATRGSSARGGSGRSLGGASTSLGAGSAAATTGWQVWWARNRDAFLWDANGQALSGPVTAQAGLLSGRGRTFRAETERPSRGTIYTRIVPLLLEQLEADDDGRVVAASLISLGSAVDADLGAPVEDALLEALNHDEGRVQLAATLGLGLLGTRSSGHELLELVSCSLRGHALVGANMVPDRLRAVAALALALGDHPDAIPQLMLSVDDLPDSMRDTKAAVLTALGLMPSARTPAVRDWLAERLVDRRLDPAIQSAVPTALARHGDPSVLPLLLAVLDDRDADRLVVQSTALALGALADVSDADVLEELQALAEDARDAETRQFAWLSLARVAARKGRLPPAPKALADVRKLLVRNLSRPPRHSDRPFVALAAGLFGRQRPEARDTLLEAMLAAFDDVNDPDLRGALAVSMGLLGDRGAGRSLREALDETRDESFAGHLAVSLGLVGYREADARLRELALRPGARRDLRESAALGLRLMGDTRASGELSDSLVKARSLDERNGLTRALGALRDVACVPTLDDVVRDESLDAASRSAACDALGGVAEKTHLPWRSRLQIGSNYMAAVADLDALLDG